MLSRLSLLARKQFIQSVRRSHDDVVYKGQVCQSNPLKLIVTWFATDSKKSVWNQFIWSQVYLNFVGFTEYSLRYIKPSTVGHQNDHILRDSLLSAIHCREISAEEGFGSIQLGLRWPTADHKTYKWEELSAVL